jgi:hypothetical protein
LIPLEAEDRAECEKWATVQAGQVAQNGSDYNRAMVACVEGRSFKSMSAQIKKAALRARLLFLNCWM